MLQTPLLLAGFFLFNNSVVFFDFFDLWMAGVCWTEPFFQVRVQCVEQKEKTEIKKYKRKAKNG
jgi:hypothetical protein